MAPHRRAPGPKAPLGWADVCRRDDGGHDGAADRDGGLPTVVRLGRHAVTATAGSRSLG